MKFSAQLLAALTITACAGNEVHSQNLRGLTGLTSTVPSLARILDATAQSKLSSRHLGDEKTPEEEEREKEEKEEKEREEEREKDEKKVDDKLDDEKKSGPGKREFKIDKTDKKDVKFECEAKKDSQGKHPKKHDKIEYELKPSDKGMKLKVDYTFDKEAKDKKGEKKEFKKDKIDFDVTFKKIVEFTPAAAGDVFDWSKADDITYVKKTVDLDSWKDMDVKGKDAKGKHVIEAVGPASVTDEATQFNYKMVNTIAEEKIEEEKLGPNFFKIDIEINNWEYTQVGNKLAMISELKGPKLGKKEKGSKEEVIKIDFDNDKKKDGEKPEDKKGEEDKPRGMFSWVEKATSTKKADRRHLAEEEVVVKSSVKEEEGDKKGKKVDIAFTFETSVDSKKILWDPEFGTVYDDEAGGTGSSDTESADTVYYVVAGVIVAALGGAGFMMARGKNAGDEGTIAKDKKLQMV
ncbi:hypothetical protein ScalyP_jg12013 [Parmales sp. scaly parma]|nr:hypothetical protein ScalyP_jg12013 [Parmales sp. scaly parma]